jgi:hypothetical protein
MTRWLPFVKHETIINNHIMETKNRIFYEAPSTKVVELKTEGILCWSYSLWAIETTMDGTFVEETI